MSKETAMALVGQAIPKVDDVKTAPLASAAEPALTADASRLAIFAKKEAAILKDKEDIRRDREALAKEKEEAELYRKRGKEFDETFAKDKKAALRMLGLSDTDVINILADQEEPKEESVEEKARKIAAEETQKIRDELKKEREDADTKQNEALVTQLKTDLSSTIKANPDKYEYCAFEGAEAELQAYEIIVETLKESKGEELLTVEQALDIAEEYYESRDKAMAQLKKRQPKVEETEVSPAKTATTASERRAPVSNTPAPKAPAVTNKLTATSTGAAIQRRETSSEKRERLIKQLSGTA